MLSGGYSPAAAVALAGDEVEIGGGSYLQRLAMCSCLQFCHSGVCDVPRNHIVDGDYPKDAATTVYRRWMLVNTVVYYL